MTDKGQKVVLVVEDDEDLGALMVQNLEQYFEVHWAKDGEEALKLGTALTPHAYLLDINLPKYNGAQVCAQIRSFPKFGHPKIIVYTGMETTKDAKAQWEKMFHIDDFFIKPLNVEWVVDRLLELLGEKKEESKSAN